MNRDGSFAVFDNGSEVRLGKGESATLSGGETVSENQDGSLLVSARSATRRHDRDHAALERARAST